MKLVNKILKGDDLRQTLVGTHSGVFHSDEVVAVALLHHHGIGGNTVRTRNNQDLAKCQILVDIGGVYAPSKMMFDHHQKSYTGALSSAGMVAEFLECNHPIIPEVDIRDNKGPGKCDPEWDNLFSTISGCNHPDIDSADQGHNFDVVVDNLVGLLSGQLDREGLIDNLSSLADQMHVLKEDRMKEAYKSFVLTNRKWVNKGDRGTSITFGHLAKGYIPLNKIDGVDAVMSYDDMQDSWQVAVDTEKCRITSCENSKFLHKAGFIVKLDFNCNQSPKGKIVLDVGGVKQEWLLEELFNASLSKALGEQYEVGNRLVLHDGQLHKVAKGGLTVTTSWDSWGSHLNWYTTAAAVKDWRLEALSQSVAMKLLGERKFASMQADNNIPADWEGTIYGTTTHYYDAGGYDADVYEFTIWPDGNKSEMTKTSSCSGYYEYCGCETVYEKGRMLKRREPELKLFTVYNKEEHATWDAFTSVVVAAATEADAERVAEGYCNRSLSEFHTDRVVLIGSTSADEGVVHSSYRAS